MKRLCGWLEMLRSEWNKRYGEGDDPIYINSGYRSEAVNKAVGGMKGSNHLTGCAVDIRVAGIEQLVRYATILLDISDESQEDFDELLLEHSSKGGYWLHFAVRPSENRRKVRLLFPSSLARSTLVACLSKNPRSLSDVIISLNVSHQNPVLQGSLMAYMIVCQENVRLIPEILTNKYDDVAAFGGVPKEVNVVADGFGRVAVVAYAVSLAGGLDVESGSIDGRCGTSCPRQSCLDGLSHFVQAYNEDDLLGPPGNGGYAITVSVDVYDDTILGDSIGAGQVDVGGKCLEIHGLLLLRRLYQVAVKHFQCSAASEVVGDAHIADGHRAAPCYTTSILNEFGNFPYCLLSRRAIECLDMAALQVFDDCLSKMLVSFFLWFHHFFVILFSILFFFVTFANRMRKVRTIEMQRLTVEEFREAKKLPLIVVLDDVRSMHNVGSVFRTADTFRVEAVYLCGITSTPPMAEIHKTALGAEESVSWQYFPTALDAVSQLKADGYTVYSVEQVEHSTKLHRFQADDERKYAVIFGNEVKGVHQEVVDASDGCLEIPQLGTKHSMNVSVTAGIVIYKFAEQLII